MNTREAFDVIVVGAGAAGAIVAARLSEDPDLSVALLEAGEENGYDIGRSQGAFYFTWGGPKNWGYQSVPQSGLGNRVVDQPRGRAIGGSTVLNVGAWLRGRPEDYDAWEQAGAAGWNADAALAAFRALEGTNRDTADLRGHDGPIRMTDLETPTELSEVLQSAYIEAGLGTRGDANGADPFVVDRYQTIFVDHVRHTIADAFLTDAVRARTNLHIITGATASRIVIEDGRATAVETLTAGGTTRTFRATREIVLSAGAIGTPQLLLLSGIGPAEDLDQLGIPVVSDLPGVGTNLQDHLMTPVQTLAEVGVEGSLPTDLSPASIEQWLTDHTGSASYWTGNGVGYAATDGHQLPDFELLLDYTTSAAAFPDVADAAERSGTGIQVVLLQPLSRGTVRLGSTDPTEHPIIDPAYLQEDGDLAALVAGVRIAQQLAAAPALAPWSAAIAPSPEASDDEIAAHIRGTATTLFHPAGTARMGATEDPTTVVIPDLRVKGVQGLRVADASVFPSLNRGHTMALAAFVGYRAADLIRGAQR